MKITFLGTGAAEGFPAVFCSCPYCQSIKDNVEKEMRTRSQVLIDGNFSIDFPPDAYYHSLRFGVDLSALKYLLVTHSHMDHFYAHDFILRGYKYANLSEDVLEIFGNSEVEKVFKESIARELKEEVSHHLSFNIISAYSVLNVGEYRVITLPAFHGTAEDALLFYVERNGRGYLHLYDTGALSDEAIKFLADNGAKAQLVAFDCTFADAPKAGLRRHMCLEDNAEIQKRLQNAVVTDINTKYVITHFSHNANPTKDRMENLAKDYGYISAYDGLCLEV
ncbi:MAG: MBL fold metallo-hydrolase [Candidatus Coproplasma sp.]